MLSLFNRVLLCLFVAMICCCQAVSGQEFRVYTRIFDDSSRTTNQPAHPASAPVISRSVSLFHAGKVYDYIDTIGEVTIFEPAQRRFRIINGSGRTATTVTFDELNHLLKLGEGEAKRQAAELAEKNDQTSLYTATLLLFLVNPQFQEHFDPDRLQLQLSSRSFSYTVQCDAGVRPEHIDRYLNYAGWAARLNAVLHPQALLPAPRLALNTALREHQLMPTQVQLTANVDRPFRLRAEHKIHWNLDKKDRSNINHWESLLRDDSLKFVTFQEYQRSFLISQNPGH